MLIWVIEIIGEWNSIEDSKEYYNPPQSTDDLTTNTQFVTQILIYMM